MIIPKGRVLGLAVTLSDTEWTTPNDTGATVDIDLSHSRLNLPMPAAAGIVAPSHDQHIDVDITEPTRRPDLRSPLN